MTRLPTPLRLAPTMFVAAIGLLSTMGLAGAWAVAQNFSTLGVILWMLPSILAGSFFVVFGTVFLQGTLIGVANESELRVAWRQGRILVLVFVAFSATLTVAASAYVYDLGTTIRRQRLDEQTSIVNLKAQLAEKWLAERWIDVDLLARSMRALPIASPDFSPNDLRLVEVLLAEFQATSREWTGVKLLRADGTLLAGAGETKPAVEKEATGLIESAKSGSARVMSVRSPTGALLLNFVVPLPQPDKASPEAYFIVTIDPGVVLLPELLRWPVESPTSEVVLVQREGDQAVFIVPPPHAPAVALPLFSFPLSRTEFVAVQAVLHGDAVREGFDYRHVLVLAASRLVKGLGWSIIAKTDVSEALFPLEQRARLVIWLTAGAIALGAAITVGLWFAARQGQADLKAIHERERRVLVQHYARMIAVAHDIVFLLDDKQMIVDANDAALNAYGYSLDELRQMKGPDLRPDRLRAKADADWAKALATGLPFEAIHCRKNGTEFPVEISLNNFTADGRIFTQSFLRDITHRSHVGS